LAFAGKRMSKSVGEQQPSPRTWRRKRGFCSLDGARGSARQARCSGVGGMYEHQVGTCSSELSSAESPGKGAAAVTGDLGEGTRGQVASGQGRGRRTGRNSSITWLTISRCWPVSHHPGRR